LGWQTFLVTYWRVSFAPSDQTFKGRRHAPEARRTFTGLGKLGFIARNDMLRDGMADTLLPQSSIL